MLFASWRRWGHVYICFLLCRLVPPSRQVSQRVRITPFEFAPIPTLPTLPSRIVASTISSPERVQPPLSPQILQDSVYQFFHLSPTSSSDIPNSTTPSQNPAQPSTLWNPGGTLVEPSWNRWNLASNHPGPPRSPRRTWWNSGGTLVEPWWNPGGTLVEPWWNLTSGPPRTTPAIWAEAPKLSAVGEKGSLQLPEFHSSPPWRSRSSLATRNSPRSG